MSKLYERTALELAALIRSKEVSSREVVQAHLDRISAVNGHVNAVTVVLAESALKAADAADAREAAGPLHGVPFTIKENIDCVGSATTNGVPALADAHPTMDAPVVARMKAAGAIPIGRTNLPEMGLRLSTDNPLRGRTLNPWHTELTAGGSSGGEAAALATGMTPFGLGNDIGGSLRNPAYCCGITSLKPTQGRIPHAGSMEPLDAGIAVQAMLVEGPMTRSVADLRMGLSILAGRDIRDPRSVDAPLIGAQPHRRRAALVTYINGANIPEATLAAIRQAGTILAAAGWEVEEAEPPELEQVSQIWGNVLSIDFADLVPQIQPMITAPLHTILSQLVSRFDPNVSNGTVHAERSRLTRLWSAFFADYPVAIGPTWTRLPWPASADLDPVTGLDLLLDTIRFITPGNVLGLPSVALPMGLADGLPTGIQIYADLWREDLALDAAQAIEAGVARTTPIDPVT
ncbi:MAG: amidase [Proteobacteria bacterium]|nr:amidase [Pseudomonadota bacterium]